MAEIKVHNIKKSYNERNVLEDVSIHIKTGEIVGLLGPNGSGKTTLFYIIAGVVATDFGNVTLDGLDITFFPMYKRARLGIGYLPQDASIFRGMTVEENINAALQLCYKNKEERFDKLHSLLKDFGIEHIKKSPSIALSGGERRRLEIARTIAINPKFVLLDEPFAGVDPISVIELRKLIEALVNLNIGVLITDHNVIETLNVVDRSYILHDGKILFQGKKADILASKEVRSVYLGHSF